MTFAPDFREGRLLRIFLDESDKSGLQPTYTLVVEFLRKHGISGATVFRGIEGYGGHQEIHMAKVFSWLPNLPILIEIIEDWSVLEPLLPQLERLVGEGMLTLEPVHFLRLSRQEMKPGCS